MAKKKAKAEKQKETTAPVLTDPFIGGEEDDLSDMEYIQDENTTTTVETHPPETEEEAELLAERDAAEEAVNDDDSDDSDAKSSDDDVKDETDAEAEEKDETTEEEKTEEEVVLEDDDPKIPKDRFDEVNDRMKSAEKKVETLEKQLEGIVEEKNAPEPAPPYDYATKEKEAMDALLEGDQDKYAALRAEIRKAEREETLAEAKKISESGDIQSREDVSFEEAGALIEEDYPQFSTQAENYNPDAREEMIDLYVGYAQSGRFTRVEALQRAAERAAKLHDLVKTGAEEVPDNVVDIKRTDVKAKVDVANNQPPEIKGKAKGESQEPITDVSSMSDEQFDALPESTKRRLRGDIL